MKKVVLYILVSIVAGGELMVNGERDQISVRPVVANGWFVLTPACTLTSGYSLFMSHLST